MRNGGYEREREIERESERERLLQLARLKPDSAEREREKERERERERERQNRRRMRKKNHLYKPSATLHERAFQLVCSGWTLDIGSIHLHIMFFFSSFFLDENSENGK
jgi:hypothetical protein